MIRKSLPRRFARLTELPLMSSSINAEHQLLAKRAMTQ